MFTKGIAKIGGRKRGTPNKLTGTFREAVCLAYQSIGGHEAFAKWAAENQTDFYKIAARLIPAENRNSDNEGVTVIIDRTGMTKDRPDDRAIAQSQTTIQSVDGPQRLRPALITSALQE